MQLSELAFHSCENEVVSKSCHLERREKSKARKQVTQVGVGFTSIADAWTNEDPNGDPSIQKSDNLVDG